MYARTTTVHADPQRVDEGIRYIRDEVMPAVQSMPGCMGLSMLCDRDSGRCIVTTSWDSEESMSASRDAVMPMRERATVPSVTLATNQSRFTSCGLAEKVFMFVVRDGPRQHGAR